MLNIESMLQSPDLLRNRYPLYAQMRQLQPVLNIPDYQIWLLFRYDEVRTALSDYENFSSDFRRSGMSMDEDAFKAMVQRQENSGLGSSLITTDPPMHRQLRDLVVRAFTPKAVEALEPRIRELANEMIDAAIQTGQIDLIKDLAYPLPVIVIAEMLGIPPEDRDQFKHWSDLIVASADRLLVETDDAESNAQWDANRQMSEYFRRIIAQRRADPRDDLISALIAAELNGERLSENNVLAFCMLLLIAGNVTTTNLIGNGMYALLEHPQEMDRLRGDLSLMPSAIEEVLRYESPVQSIFRFAINDVEIGGQTIRRGDRVMSFIGSANRDETKFPEADRFDITRQPNPHIAFGFGVHYCLGAPLARLEGRVALTALLQRLENIERVDDTPLELAKGILIHGVASLPLRFTEST
jgi:cytochrome P450